VEVSEEEGANKKGKAKVIELERSSDEEDPEEESEEEPMEDKFVTDH